MGGVTDIEQAGQRCRMVDFGKFPSCLGFCSFILMMFLNLPLAASERFSRTELLMGNVQVAMVIDAPLKSKWRAFDVMSRAFEEGRHVEERVSEWHPDSDLSRLNQNPGIWVPIGHDLMTILETAEQISRESNGAFDITFASCPSGWSKPRCPYSYKDVHLIPELGLASIRQGVSVGVSGIAKGYIVDRMSSVLRKPGFRHHLVNAGDLFASGTWEIEIRDPGGAEDDTLCTLHVTDKAVSTSGTYERGNHIINPETDKPVLQKGSTTIVADRSILADAWAKVLFVLGPEKSDALLKNHRELQALFINEQNQISPPGLCATHRGE